MAGKKQNRDQIRIGDYIITADSLQWILSKEHISEGSKNPNLANSKGKLIVTVLGYYTKLNHLVAAISEDVMKDNLGEVNDLRELIEVSMLELAQNVKKLKS